MKKLFFSFLFLFAASSITAQEINWMTMNEALAAQQKEPRMIFMDAYTTWCGPCKMLDRNTFAHKDVASYINENFYAVKFNAEGNEEITFKGEVYTNPGYDAKRRGRNTQHQLAQALQVTGYPSMAFIDENGGLIFKLVGYYEPREIEPYLKAFGGEEHKAFKSYDDLMRYTKNYKNEFAK